jgi:hypothetical protein
VEIQKPRVREYVRRVTDPNELRVLRQHNNPSNKPVGAFTKRCHECGSKLLWASTRDYGCNCCGYTFSTDQKVKK